MPCIPPVIIVFCVTLLVADLRSLFFDYNLTRFFSNRFTEPNSIAPHLCRHHDIMFDEIPLPHNVQRFLFATLFTYFFALFGRLCLANVPTLRHIYNALAGIAIIVFVYSAYHAFLFVLTVFVAFLLIKYYTKPWLITSIMMLWLTSLYYSLFPLFCKYSVLMMWS